jgi:hypothetical protein
LNKPGGSAIYQLMHRFRNIFFALAAFLWLPASAHCQFETVNGLEFLQCDPFAQSQGACDGNVCCQVEKSQYKTDQASVSVPSPGLLPLLFVVFAGSNHTEPEQITADSFNSLPPELPQCWQFVFRMASPPRAPSFAS